MSEPEGRGAAWTEERATEERATRDGGASGAPGSEPESAASRRGAGEAGGAPEASG